MTQHLPLITVYHHPALTELTSSYYLLTVFKQYQNIFYLNSVSFGFRNLIQQKHQNTGPFLL